MFFFLKFTDFLEFDPTWLSCVTYCQIDFCHIFDKTDHPAEMYLRVVR